MPPTGLVKLWRDVPTDEGQRICLRPLSTLEHQSARAIKDDADREMAMRMTASIGESAREAVASISPEDREEARARNTAKAADDTEPDNFDAATVLRCGIVAWTYEDADGAPYPCTEDTRTTLDPAVGDWAIREILSLSARTPGNATSSAKSSATARSRRS